MASNTKNALQSAGRGAGYNIILQLLFRIATFVLNAFIVRRISKQLLGVVNVRLTLLYTTGLFLSREALRRACLSKTDEGCNVRHVVNLMWATVPIGVLCTGLLSAVWIFLLEQPPVVDIPDYPQAVIAFAVCTVAELMAEPLYVLAQRYFYVRVKVMVEGGALAARVILTGTLVALYPEWGLFSFCISYVLYAVVFVMLYYGFFTSVIKDKSSPIPISSWGDLLPQPAPNQPLLSLSTWTSPRLVYLAVSFFKQSFFKQILTEGERYVMTFFRALTFQEQGIFDTIANLGSMVARFVFMPIEESYSVFFTTTLQRGLVADQQPPAVVKTASSALSVLLKFVFLVGLIIVVFGWSYSYLLLMIYGGDKLTASPGPAILRTYCFYVLVLAVNGMTECFYFATMSKEEIDRYNRKMLLFSFMLLGLSWLLTTTFLGSLGFIIANSVQMCARIVYSASYIRRYFASVSEDPLSKAMPAPATWLSLVVSLFVTVLSEHIFCCNTSLFHLAIHVAIGAACLLMVLACLFVFEKDLVQFIRQNILARSRPD
ncbi:protein RFT1 homolog [Sycon ciliatum]|uniref:protein RFT1 homolog n=1 Tax=Sycon ciliatum TaxID=27933 RepID=UPI0031F6F25A